MAEFEKRFAVAREWPVAMVKATGCPSSHMQRLHELRAFAFLERPFIMPGLTPSPTARVFDIQRFSIHDGPGTRTTIFFKGCPLHCGWCQNPESQGSEPELLIADELCMECGACREACPLGEEWHGSMHGYRPGRCRSCGQCVSSCATGARQLAGRDVTLDELEETALRDQFLYGSEGGATLGGGEPLVQWQAAFELATRLRRRGVHMALDTSGVAPEEVLCDVPLHFDLVMLDLKLASPEKHLACTGQGNDRTRLALEILSERLPERLWISVPLIPGVHDRDELNRMAGMVSGLRPIPPVRLIPYHRLGDGKYLALGTAPPRFDVSKLPRLREWAQEAFRRAGVPLL